MVEFLLNKYYIQRKCISLLLSHKEIDVKRELNMSNLNDLTEMMNEFRERDKRSVYFVKKENGKYLKCDIESEATHFILGNRPSPVVFRELAELPENYIVKSWKVLDEYFNESNRKLNALYKEFDERERSMRVSPEDMRRSFDL